MEKIKQKIREQNEMNEMKMTKIAGEPYISLDTQQHKVDISAADSITLCHYNFTLVQ